MTAGQTVADATSGASEREIVVTRVLDAPRQLVWQVWHDPKHVSRWWGPRGFTTTTHSMDFRVGGTWRFTMHGPDGTDYPNDVRYTEIVEPELLAYDHGAEEGDEPHFRARVTFADRGGRTEVTLRMVAPSAGARAEMAKYGAVEGGQQTLERLAELLATL